MNCCDPIRPTRPWGCSLMSSPGKLVLLDQAFCHACASIFVKHCIQIFKWNILGTCDKIHVPTKAELDAGEVYRDVLPCSLCTKHTRSHLSLSIPVLISSSAVFKDLVCKCVRLADGDTKAEDMERGMSIVRAKQMYLTAIL